MKIDYFAIFLENFFIQSLFVARIFAFFLNIRSHQFGIADQDSFDFCFGLVFVHGVLQFIDRLIKLMFVRCFPVGFFTVHNYVSTVMICEKLNCSLQICFYTYIYGRVSILI